MHHQMLRHQCGWTARGARNEIEAARHTHRQPANAIVADQHEAIARPTSFTNITNIAQAANHLGNG
jgi:hypothetical protein